MAGETITLEEGIAWCATFREEYPNDTRAYTLSKSLIEEIINQDKCDGIRIYNAIDDANARCVVLVGINSSNKDMVDGTLVDRADPCPTHCDVSSPLNANE